MSARAAEKAIQGEVVVGNVRGVYGVRVVRLRCRDRCSQQSVCVLDDVRRCGVGRGRRAECKRMTTSRYRSHSSSSSALSQRPPPAWTAGGAGQWRLGGKTRSVHPATVRQLSSIACAQQLQHCAATAGTNVQCGYGTQRTKLAAHPETPLIVNPLIHRFSPSPFSSSVSDGVRVARPFLPVPAEIRLARASIVTLSVGRSSHSRRNEKQSSC